MTEVVADGSEDVAAGFAALMNKAAEQADTAAADAPFGYTTDPDGTTRPKKAAGRPRKSPTVAELKEQKAAQPPADPAGSGDRAPSAPKRTRRGKPAAEPKADKPVPQFREGQIERAVNKLYRRAGKMIRAMDRDIGQALIDITRKEDAEDTTVGEAWEELARHNPRIRRVLLKMIGGGAWGQLFWIHAPVFMAVLMKDAIRRHIPFAKLMDAFLDGSEDGEAPADGTPLEGLTMPDMGQMMAMAQQFAEQAMSGRQAGGPSPRPPVPSPVGPGVTAAVPAASAS